jgi:hypothetical protein
MSIHGLVCLHHVFGTDVEGTDVEGTDLAAIYDPALMVIGSDWMGLHHYCRNAPPVRFCWLELLTLCTRSPALALDAVEELGYFGLVGAKPTSQSSPWPLRMVLAFWGDQR